jgi:hypothetical protein
MRSTLLHSEIPESMPACVQIPQSGFAWATAVCSQRVRARQGLRSLPRHRRHLQPRQPIPVECGSSAARFSWALAAAYRPWVAGYGVRHRSSPRDLHCLAVIEASRGPEKICCKSIGLPRTGATPGKCCRTRWENSHERAYWGARSVAALVTAPHDPTANRLLVLGGQYPR